jgi:assimilatory nitrate reductase catalytic subunit
VTETATHCPYCALQCGMTITADRGVVTITPRDFPTNRGGLCQKGWTSADLLMSPGRLSTPLVRDSRGEPLRPASWDEALDRVATAITALQAESGADAIGVFGGGGLTNEKSYALGKFARVALRTSKIDYNGRYCMSSAAAGGVRAFGIDRGLPFPVTDIRTADAVLLVGSNVAETMPPFVQHLTDMQRHGGALIVVDPRRTPTAQSAALHLQLTPGTDLALALALLHLAMTEGHVDKAYIAERTNGFDETWRRAATWWPERAERVTGVPVEQMREAVRLLGTAERAMVLTARGAEQQSKGTDTVSGFINLALALGLPGRPASGYGCLTGQGNGQGGREHGQKADQLPGYRKIDDPAARAHVAAVWGVDPDDLPQPGVSAYELIKSIGTPAGPRGLLVFGSNLVVSSPDARVVDDRLAALDLLVVADLVLSETAARADVVLPVAQWAEEDGTMTNLEGRVLRRAKAVEPPAGVRTDLEVLSGLAQRLGCGEKFPSDPAAVFAELRRASAGGLADYAGVTWERAASVEGVFWPCPDEAHPGTPRLFEESFPTADGRANFLAVEHRPVAEDIDDEFPLYLTTGRVLAHYQSGAQTRLVKALNDAAPEVFVEAHPELAARLHLHEGDGVRVTSRRGIADAVLRVTESIRPDTLFMPFHWGGAGRANSLTNAALDPTSRMPEFKVCAVRMEAAPAEAAL